MRVDFLRRLIIFVSAIRESQLLLTFPECNFLSILEHTKPHHPFLLPFRISIHRLFPLSSAPPPTKNSRDLAKKVENHRKKINPTQEGEVKATFYLATLIPTTYLASYHWDLRLLTTPLPPY